MSKLYHVDLSEAERDQLLALTRKGTERARKCRRAHVLLLASEGRSDGEIVTALHIGRATVERTRKRFVEEGLAAALTEKRRPGRERKLDGCQEAFLVALACSPAPEGRSRWTLQLLAAEMVALGVTETLSDDTVRRRLKESSSSPGCVVPGACPP